MEEKPSSPSSDPTPPPAPEANPPIPDEERLPLHGKLVPPTVVPSAEERMANLQKTQKMKRRRGFLIGLLVGQILVVAMGFGGDALIHALKHKVQFRAPIPIQSLVFIGMTAGILITGLLIFFILGLQGAGYVFGTKKVGFFTAVGRGIKRTMKAAWSLGLTLGIIGGTAWLMIPRAQWKPTADYLEGQGRKAYDTTRGWVESVIKPPSDPSSEAPRNP